MRSSGDAVSGDDDEGGSGELFDEVCIGCRSEKFHRAGAAAQDQAARARPPTGQ
jgi:hypothetical protein